MRGERETAAEATPDAGVDRVGGGFITLYALAYLGTSLVFIAPLLVSLALKVNSLVGIDRAPSGLALVTGTGSLLAIFANPLFGRLSDRTSSRMGMRRPWMVTGLTGGSLGILMVALAPHITVVLAGWCIAQLLFNALLAALAALYHATMTEASSIVVFMSVATLLGALSLFLVLIGLIGYLVYQTASDDWNLQPFEASGWAGPGRR